MGDPGLTTHISIRLKDDRTEVATLYVFSGLPGVGKSTLSMALVQRIRAVYLRIDTIEQALRDSFRTEIQTEGYTVAFQIAADQLRLGLDVVADCCNPVEASRNAWEQTALDRKSSCLNIEVVCSDRMEHRRRVESRLTPEPGPKVPTWSEVENHDYEPWSRGRILIDTAGKAPKDSFAELCRNLGLEENRGGEN